jgi:hypothetical protein
MGSGVRVLRVGYDGLGELVRGRSGRGDGIRAGRFRRNNQSVNSEMYNTIYLLSSGS